ncbi:MAG: SPASM domain-containing protein [Planctomycetota bacterium]
MSGTSRIPTLIEVDPQTSRRGLPSQLAADLGGHNILQRTLQRVQAATRIEAPLLICRKEHEAAVRELLGDMPAQIFTHSLPQPSHQNAIRRSRKWGKEGWRGGLLDSYFVSEQGNSRAIGAALAQHGWRSVLLLPAAAPFLDPAILDEIAGHCLDGMEAKELYLSTAPPGIGGDVLSGAAAAIVAENEAPLDALVRVEPDNPLADPERWAHHFPEEITGFRGRFTVDSANDLALARALWQLHGGAVPCRQLFDTLRANPELVAGVVPEELILELGADAGGVVAPRTGFATGALDDAVFGRVLEALGQRDDALLTLGGGYHDPLLDPRLEERIAAARAAGAFGIHIATPGALLTPERAAALLATGPDVVTVDTMAPVQEQLAPQTPPLAQREGGLEALLAARGTLEDPPLVLVSMILDERSALHFDRYFDRWYGRVDRVLFRGADGPCGEQLPSSMGVFAPPHRTACGRLNAQLRVEANGCVPLCDRDPLHSMSCGDLRVSSVAEVWQGGALRNARAAHRDRQWQQHGHCGACTSWFRFDGVAAPASDVGVPAAR